MKFLLIIWIAFSLIASSSLAANKKASPEAKAKTKVKSQVKTKQTTKKNGKFTTDKNKVRQNVILKELKNEMTIKKGPTPPPPTPEDVHPSQQF